MSQSATKKKTKLSAGSWPSQPGSPTDPHFLPQAAPLLSAQSVQGTSLLSFLVGYPSGARGIGRPEPGGQHGVTYEQGNSQ